MKIAYFITSLYNSGGMERVLTVKANYLTEKFGYKVFIITTRQFDRPPFYKLNSDIKIINLNIGSEHCSQNILIRRLKTILDTHEYKRRSKKLLDSLNVNVAVSMGGKEFSFLNKFDDQSVKIAEYHFSRNSRSIVYQSLSIYQKLLFKYETFVFEKNIKEYAKFVVLTEGDKQDWSEYSNVETIPNPLTLRIDGDLSSENTQVLAVGRYVHQKGFETLIRIWSKIHQRFPDWNLKIKGDGVLKRDYEELIKRLNLHDSIILEGSSDNMADSYLSSSVFVMTSLYEGLPLALIEAISYGLPAIAFDCKHGPKDIIEDNKNGYLIDEGDEDSFAEKLEVLLADVTKRKMMSKQAKSKSKEFEVGFVMKKWQKLFTDCISSQKDD